MDEIRIDNLKVYAYHGVLEKERKDGQFFYINAVLSLNLQRAGILDDLNASVSYADVCEWIIEMMQEKKCLLIEAVAEKIAIGILKRSEQIMAITLEVRKPEAPIDAEFESVSVCIHRKRHTAYVAFGSNEGDSINLIETGIAALDHDPMCRVVKFSEIYRSIPYGEVKQNDFYNGIMEVETYYEPEELLRMLQVIENEQGRVRTVHWGPRTLDLDIIFYDNLVYDSKTLQIPHPDAHNRDFVLAPMNSLEPNYRHPLLHLTVAEMLANITDTYVLSETKSGSSN
ncbi:MAG TPA: 2-amino-4-hydroxy-6-hydroxymethyldihydropteridine diphosphokinase [Lachnospiraceae bacterium]|nr:2-amino-4-hydroxy-6-hydroxymethyldihydropteridine diphosphokinase [Lachnospiraceae bacterium]